MWRIVFSFKNASNRFPGDDENIVAFIIFVFFNRFGNFSATNIFG